MSRFVIMGVAGSGKSTVGRAISERCGIAFIDGDDLHTTENIRKMSSGIPLNDADRAPWLIQVGKALSGAQGPVAVACSALQRSYRDIIRAHAPQPVHFLHLAADREVLSDRMKNRDGHFMPASLIDSQFAALQPLEAEEQGIVIDVAGPLDTVIDQAACYISQSLA